MFVEEGCSPRYVCLWHRRRPRYCRRVSDAVQRHRRPDGLQTRVPQFSLCVFLHPRPRYGRGAFELCLRPVPRTHSRRPEKPTTKQGALQLHDGDRQARQQTRSDDRITPDRHLTAPAVCVLTVSRNPRPILAAFRISAKGKPIERDALCRRIERSASVSVCQEPTSQRPISSVTRHRSC